MLCFIGVGGFKELVNGFEAFVLIGGLLTFATDLLFYVVGCEGTYNSIIGVALTARKFASLSNTGFFIVELKS